jgi:hypothetical protein
MITDKINHICFENKLLRITVTIFSLILFCLSLFYVFIGVSELITVSTGSSAVIDNYHFGSESMVGVGGLIYRTKYHYVFYNLVSSLLGVASLYFTFSVLKDRKYYRIIFAIVIIILQILMMP